MAEPFTDEELKRIYGSPDSYTTISMVRRLIDTITADRKRIEALGDKIDSDRTIILKFAAMTKLIADRTAEIERLRGALHDIKVWAIAGTDLDPDTQRMIGQIANKARQALDVKEE